MENKNSATINAGLSQFTKNGFTNDDVDKFLIKVLQMRPDVSSHIIPFIRKRKITDKDCIRYLKIRDGIGNGGFITQNLYTYGTMLKGYLP